ncbi:MAG: ABC transporter ATP-binding protein [Oscillibacter sp.]|nr:ABC transporter ATP-binding protein [Oscillibacter sp.]
MFWNKKENLDHQVELSGDYLLEVRDLNVNIQVEEDTLHAVRGVNFVLRRGETLGLVGESGCGKSVTSKEIVGINPGNCSSKGEVLFRTKTGKVFNLLELEKDGVTYRALRGTEIAMIFQEPMTAFSPLYTVGNQLSEIILIHEPGTTKQQARERVLEMLKKVGIANPEKRIDQYPHEFSGGMLQRALIAMMLCCDPTLLIADEPTTALDVTIQAQILELMKSLQKEFGMSILFITHDLGTVASMCDRVAVMYLGQIVETGSVRQIFHNAQHPYTRGLLKSLPKMNQNRDERLYAIRGVVPVPVGLKPSCGFHERCEECMAGKCDSMNVEPVEVEPGHFVRCLLSEEGKVRA